MSEQFGNNAQTVVVSGLNNVTSPVTFVVASAAAFPTTGNFRVLVEAEILLVTVVAGTSFTATRAQEGSSAVAHANGSTVTQVVTSGGLRQFLRDREGVFNVNDYGAFGTGADEGVLINLAIAAAAVNHGTVFFPRPVSQYASSIALNLNDTSGVSLLGEHYARLGGPTIVFTGASGSLISAKSAFGLEIGHLQLHYNHAAYAGDLVDCSPSASLGDTAYIDIHDCVVQGTGAALARSLIRMKQVVHATVERCLFQSAVVGLRLGDTSYVNVLSVNDNAFTTLSTSSIHVGDAGTTMQAVRWNNNSFEPLTSGAATAITCHAAALIDGLVCSNNWCGDSTAIGSWITIRANGAVVSANTLYGFVTATALSVLGGSDGLSITGNWVYNCTNGVTFGATVVTALVAGNFFDGASVPNPIANPGNVTRLSQWANTGLDDRVRGPSTAEMGVKASSGGAEGVLRATTGTWVDVGSVNNVGARLMTNNTARVTVDTNGHLSVLAGYIEGFEITAPVAPAANGGRLFWQDNGAGKTQLCVIYATGGVRVLDTQP